MASGKHGNLLLLNFRMRGSASSDSEALGKDKNSDESCVFVFRKRMKKLMEK